jgi:hypothetical protein
MKDFEQSLRDTATTELARLERKREGLVVRLDEIDSEIALYKGMATMPSYGIDLLRRRIEERKEEEPKEVFFQSGI